MKVRTTLFLLSTIFVIIIVVLGYVMFNTSKLVNNEIRDSESATQIIKDIFELNIVTYEYLTYHEERMHQQWLIKYDSLGKSLDRMRTEESHTEHLSILESITSDYESLGNFFSLLQENLIKREKLIEENKPQAEIDLSLSSEKRLSSQALIRSQRMASEAFIFSALMEQRIAQVQQRTNSIALLSIIGFIVLSFSISFFTTRAITKPLNELVHSAEIIGKGNLKHRVDIKTRNEIGELAVAFNQMIEMRQLAEVQINHLNRVLRAIRNVNLLITKERDLDRLIESACDCLIETDSYGSAWILLLNEDGTPSKFSRKDITGHSMSLADLPQQGEAMVCTQAILAQAGVQVIKDGADMCQDCFLISNIPGSSNTLVSRLEYNGVIYGAINVAVLKEYAIDAEEISLFAEVAGDISFALFSIELETERKRAEEKLKDYTEGLEEKVNERTQELRDAQEEMVRQERKSALGQIAGGMAHELRHPLGVISNSIYYLQTVFSEDDESTNEYMGMISSEITKADKLISNLLDFTHLRTPEREEIMVSELIKQVLKVQPPPQSVKVSIVIPDDTPLLVVDPGQISQVLDNLVENAYQAMPEGGALIIGAERHDGRIILSIQDTGCGISEENMKKLFDPLFSTKERGIGLGLAISKSIMEANGGSIEVESEEGVGSTFTLHLPINERTS